MRTVGLIENQSENWLENQWISNTPKIANFMQEEY
jgi:hypothetical protein